MKIAYGIIHRRGKEIESDMQTGRFELYIKKPKFANVQEYKVIKVRLVVKK